jgi:calcineurin-like phosphoesterase family protein
LSDDTFLIEIRLGRTKWRIKRITEEIARIFSLADFSEKHPHVTLFGPFSLKTGITVPQLLNTVEEAARPFSPAPFLIDGYDMNQGLNGAVIAFKVIPTDALADLNDAVASSVCTLAQTFKIWDTNPEQKWFHVTIANRLDRARGSSIYQQLTGNEPVDPAAGGVALRILNGIRGALGGRVTSKAVLLPQPPLIDEDGLRISVLQGDTILAEYDLVQHRWFSPSAQHAAAEWQRSQKLLRRSSGIELTKPCHHNKPDTYVISDLHFGHANIIRYCSRPFPHDAVEEMDEMLIRNWNYTVTSGDHVVHLGDLCYGPHAKSPVEYLQRLNGSITLIGGNHDSDAPPALGQQSLLWNDIPFTFVHDPSDAPDRPGGWIIHGHHHNNRLKEFPFINFEKRRINASAEVIRYRPVSLTELCNLIKDQQVRPNLKSLLLRQD